jgi:hypothetical protein
MTRPTPFLRRNRLLAGALLGAAIVAPAAHACTSPVARVDVYDRAEQRTLDIHRHRGRQYVVGQPGHEYAIRIRNCSDRRVLAVVSVDGVNVVTGDTAAPDQSGYVIEPYGYATIEGWRKDLERTAAFYFSDPGDAYATRTGRPDDLGVIGVALFREREPRWAPAPESVAAAPSAAQDAARQESTADAKASRHAMESAAGSAAPLGTGHGRREWSPVQQVEFERASSRPDQRVVIRYDRRENLVAQGVLPRQSRPWREPDPFPATLGFVPDP